MSAEAPTRDRIEGVSWALLAAATVGSAWCAYEAALWSSEHSVHLADASIAQFASARRTTVASRDLTVDVTTFVEYVVADLHGDAKVAGFLRAHARPEFKPALEAWIADKASGRTELPNPFARPEYRVAASDQASDLDALAARDLSAAHDANRNNDVYVLHTVLFALALFFLGATSEARRGAGRRVALVFGTLVFVLTAISVARLPRASMTLPRQLHANAASAELGRNRR